MGPIAETDSDFVFEGLPPIPDVQELTAGQPADPLGPLAQLPGTWKGHGFNTIWRPHHPSQQQDRFLELNLTTETIVFSKINGAIPNRGLAMPDINMHGITYMQQISDTTTGKGLHVEPGIWAAVPPTTRSERAGHRGAHGLDPPRHGDPGSGNHPVPPGRTTEHPQQQHPPVRDRRVVAPEFGFQLGCADVLRAPPDTRTPSSASRAPGITQAMVKNPNSVLQAAIQGKTVKNRTFIQHHDEAQPDQGRWHRQHRIPVRFRGTRRAAMPTPSRSTPRSGSRRSPGTGGQPDSFSSSTPAGAARLQRTELAARHRGHAAEAVT